VEQASQYYRQFSKFWSGKNLHEIRDTVKTMIPNLAGVDRTLVAFVAGHQIDPLDYEKLRDAEKYGLMDEIYKQWSRALPYLNLWSQAGQMTTNIREVTALRKQLNSLESKFLVQDRILKLLLRDRMKGADPMTEEQIREIQNRTEPALAKQ
jgi:hypothetical protein